MSAAAARSHRGGKRSRARRLTERPRLRSGVRDLHDDERRAHVRRVEARRVLKSWVDDHLEDPYPTVNEKNQMAQAAGLTIKQVNDWFTNYRKRHWEGEMMVARI